jgi:prepilin-type N-terminal cleavage/methylation domain-containing protein
LRECVPLTEGDSRGAKRPAGGRSHTLSHSGITLVELLVVMVILAISLSVVIPSLGNSYDNWLLRSTGRQTVAFFRAASDTARRDATDIAGFYDDHRLVLMRNGSIFKRLDIPDSITVRPGKPRGIVFLSTGQAVASEPFVFENQRGRRVVVEPGPLPGQVSFKEEMR